MTIVPVPEKALVDICQWQERKQSSQVRRNQKTERFTVTKSVGTLEDMVLEPEPHHCIRQSPLRSLDRCQTDRLFHLVDRTPDQCTADGTLLQNPPYSGKHRNLLCSRSECWRSKSSHPASDIHLCLKAKRKNSPWAVRFSFFISQS